MQCSDDDDDNKDDNNRVTSLPATKTAMEVHENPCSVGLFPSQTLAALTLTQAQTQNAYQAGGNGQCYNIC